MSLTIPFPDFIPGTTIASAQVDANNAAIVAKFAKGIGALDITDGSLTDALMAVEASVQNYFASFTETSQPTGFTETGLQGNDQAASLTHTITAGVAYPRQTSSSPDKLVRVEKTSGTSHTYTANKDTYVDIKADGTFTFIELANGSGEPSVTVDSTRLMLVVSGANTLTVTDKRTLITTSSSQEHFRFGLFPEYLTTATFRLTSGSANVGSSTITQRGVTASVDITNAGNFISGAPGASQWQWVVITDSGAGTPTIKLTTSAPNASDTVGTATGVLLYRSFAGVYYRYVGALRTDGGSNLVKFYRIDDMVLWADTKNVLTAGAAVAYTAVGLTTVVPPTSRKALMSSFLIAAGGGNIHYFRATGSGDVGTRFQSSSSNVPWTWWQHTDASQSIDYKLQAAGSLDIDVMGYREDF